MIAHRGLILVLYGLLRLDKNPSVWVIWAVWADQGSKEKSAFEQLLRVFFLIFVGKKMSFFLKIL